MAPIEAPAIMGVLGRAVESAASTLGLPFSSEVPETPMTDSAFVTGGSSLDATAVRPIKNRVAPLNPFMIVDLCLRVHVSTIFRNKKTGKLPFTRGRKMLR
eukprot:Gregarina_sp_Poly_1__542@NODE_112_length_13900_cov_236_895034_g99_i0_p16_GENE_NODE_112_length_13900_cov_236_895034_g99_i0NODE_112_length_13900_cov_236_895034_g99_i0_p16_ORF_typecomplete_len101_score10_68HTH_17/PF12728_7/0_3_NODE_112_length_13900_cov_236_895034_g99_i031623464